MVSSLGNSTAQKFGYNGKELNDEFGINWYDFGARNYDASLGRWMNIDALADLSPDWTPYRYAYNNPLIFVDPDGNYEWRINSKTGEYERFGDKGGKGKQYIFFDKSKEASGVINGEKFYVGVVSNNWHKDGDISFGVSNKDLWSGLPDEYQGAYTLSDLSERYDAKEKGGAKWKSIQKQESKGLARRDQIWNNKDYSRYLLKEYGSNSALLAAYDTELLEEMLPLPFKAGDAYKAIKGVRSRDAIRQLKRKPQLIYTSTKKFSKNRWIRYLQQNSYKYKGKGLGKNWIKQAAADYRKLYGK